MIASSKFKMEDGSMIEMSVEILHKKVIAFVNDVKLEVEHTEILSDFYIGITACEGSNRFYDFK